MDFTVLQKLDAKGTFADMKNEYVTQFSPTTYSKVAAEKPILTQTIRINFYPNSANIFEPQHDEFGNALASTLYDQRHRHPGKVGRLAGQYERAVIAVVGHTDSSMKGKVPRSEVERLSLDRANSVKNALVESTAT